VGAPVARRGANRKLSKDIGEFFPALFSVLKIAGFFRSIVWGSPRGKISTPRKITLLDLLKIVYNFNHSKAMAMS
jgi:hypothetical protein